MRVSRSSILGLGPKVSMSVLRSLLWGLPKKASGENRIYGPMLPLRAW